MIKKLDKLRKFDTIDPSKIKAGITYFAVEVKFACYNRSGDFWGYTNETRAGILMDHLKYDCVPTNE